MSDDKTIEVRNSVMICKSMSFEDLEKFKKDYEECIKTNRQYLGEVRIIGNIPKSFFISFGGCSCGSVDDHHTTECYLGLDSFGEVVKPVMEWLAKSKNPHTKIIVDSTSAELVEGAQCFNTDEFIRD